MIIGFTGSSGSGKSTASNVLVKEYGFIKINFKDFLVEEIRERFPLLLTEVNSYYHFKDEGELLSAYPRPPLLRALMINYGTDVRRKDNPFYWTNAWYETIQHYTSGTNIVVDDVRFLNEADVISSVGGMVYRISNKTLVSQFSGHISETEMNSITPTQTLYNTGTREEFESQVRTLMTTLIPAITIPGEEL